MTKEHKTFEGKVRSLDRLMEHRADIRDHKDRMLIFNDIKMMFEESKIKYDEDLLFRLFCKVIIKCDRLTRASDGHLPIKFIL